jgi:hypothetical protein
MDAEERKDRVEVLKLAASMTSPNCSLDSVLPVADKLWAWATGEKPPQSKVSKAVDRGLAKLSASQGTTTQASE